MWIIAGAVAPLPVNAVYVFGWLPGLRQDYTPLGFAFSALFFTLGMFRHRLFNLTPIARTVLVDTMPDGLIVLDPSLVLVDLNPAARSILDLPAGEDLVGRKLTEYWPDCARWDSDPTRWPDIVRIQRGETRRAYGLRCTHLKSNSSNDKGWLVVMTDVSQRVDTEEALALANQSLEEANSALRRLNGELEGRIAARTVALTQRAKELEAVARVSSVLRKADGLEELQNILLEETLVVLEASAGAVFLLEEDDLVLSAVQALPALPGTHLGPCIDPLWRVVDTGVALHLSRAAVDREPASPLLLSLIGRCSELSIAPVHASNRILGLLLLVFDHPMTTMLDEYARLLTAIAEMAGNAFQRVRTVENLETLVQDRTRDLSALYEVTTASNLALDLPDLLTRVLATVVQVLGSRAAVLHLIEDGRVPLLTQPAYYTAGQFPAGEQDPLAIGNGVEGEGGTGGMDPGAIFESFPMFLAAHSGLQPFVLEMLPAPHEATSPWVQVLTQRGVVVVPSLPVPIYVEDGLLAACVSVPVRAKGRILGVLSVLVKSIGRFSAEDIALLAAISDHVGGAVERAKLIQRAEEAAVIEERQRLARDLHDSVTQSLYSLVLFAEAGRDALIAGNPDKTGSHLERLRDTSQQALKEMRLLIYELRPLILQDEGLLGALRHRLDAVERRSGIDARFEVEHLEPLPERLEIGLYGIAQEALNNVLKHAHATSLTLRLNSSTAGVEMEIKDNGQGFPDNSRTDGGIGLASMRERARALGGELTVQSEPGQGTSILVRILQEETR